MYEKGANADGRTHKKCRDFVIALGLWFTARARLDRQISKINQFLASDFVRSTRFFFQKREKQRKIQDIKVYSAVYVLQRKYCFRWKQRNRPYTQQCLRRTL